MILRIIIPLLLSLFFKSSWAAPTLKSAKFNTVNQFNKVKVQIVDLISKNQRIAAMTLIENELLREDKDYKSKLNSLKFNMLNDFISLPAQEIYETSMAIVLSDKKKAVDGLKQCLAIEPENLQCRWLELKYQRRYNFGIFKDKALVYLETAQNFKQLERLKNSLLIALDRTSEVVIDSNSKEIKNLNNEDLALENIVNYNLALENENFLKAKEILNFMNMHFPDYPDLIFMSYQLSTLWPQGVPLSSTILEQQFEVYQKKCSDLPVSLARKYFFDISLCVRSIK